MSNISRVAGKAFLADLHWPETSKGRAYCKTSESHFCDRSIYDPFLGKLIHEAFCDLYQHGRLDERFAVGGEG